MYGKYSSLYVSVFASGRDGIRAARKKLDQRYRRARRYRGHRHAFYRQMLDYHQRSRDLVGELRL
jgi:hypothetical protein